MNFTINNKTAFTLGPYNGAIYIMANSTYSVTNQNIPAFSKDNNLLSDLLNGNASITIGNTEIGTLTAFNVLFSLAQSASTEQINNSNNGYATVIAGIDSTGNVQSPTLTTINNKKTLDVNISSNQNDIPIKFGKNDQITALGRLKTSSQNVLLDISFCYNLQPLYLNTRIVGSGTANFNSSDDSCYLSTTTNSSDSAIIQSRQYFKYVAGNCYRASVGSNPGSTIPNVTKRIGLFDSNNGMFFQFTSNGVSVVIRSSLSGSVVDTIISQSNWNSDKLDGTGLSGITLDINKYNVFSIEFTWQGSGCIRFGILGDEGTVYCHEVTNFNILNVPFMETATLPMRAEISNSATTSGSSVLKIWSIGYQDEISSLNKAKLTFSVSTGTTALSTTTTLKPLLSIKPSQTFNGETNRINMFPETIQILAGSVNTLIRVYLNPTLSGTSWVNVDTNSSAQYDISSTSISGGTKILEFYVPANSGLLSPTVSGASGMELQRLILSQNINASSQDVLTVAAVSLGGGTNTYGAITWSEDQ